GSQLELNVLDPFAGSGTTAVSVADLVRDGTLKRARVVGYECNPFLHLVAATKMAALQRPSKSFLALAKKIAAMAARDKVSVPAAPALSAFHNPKFFAVDDVNRLLQIREAIQLAADAGAHPLDIDLARLCLGAAAEPVSSLRRDGRALRFEPFKERARPVAEFLRRAEFVDDDMPRSSVRISGQMILGDGRTLQPQRPRPATVDLALFSPPYPNNIDYTEVYKLEAWLLGFIADSEGFASQRLKTVYSHPSLLREASVHGGGAADDLPVTATVGALVDAVPEDRYSRARRSMILGYSRDMMTMLATVFATLRPGAQLVYVVGNSLHGAGDSAFVIAADLLLAEFASNAGFDVERIEVARQLRRRVSGSHLLRESVVFLRRPTLSAQNALRR
ncbi:MAG: site-specific DNA-methyltransferase, partial [Actinobacteria bacterium]|nr:site-specific DNA-methyltransferase [Actinomycetota bacterium]